MVAVAVEISVPQILKLRLRFVKVSVVGAARADDGILLTCFECS